MVIYLNIPYSSKKTAKEYGGLWDKKKKCWYCEDENNELWEYEEEYRKILGNM